MAKRNRLRFGIGLDSMRTKREHLVLVTARCHAENGALAMSDRLPVTENSHYEQACDQAIAMCGGNMRGAIKALIMANEFLEHELEELQAVVSGGLTRSGQPRARGVA